MAAGDVAQLPPDEDQGPAALGPILSLFAISVIVYSIRMWSRLWPKPSLTAADYIITLAMVTKTISTVFFIMAVRLGFGRHTAYVTETRARISSVLLAVFMTGVATSSLSRISIATLLFRFTANRKWRAVLWIIIAIQIVAVIAYVTVQLVQCRLVIAGTVLKPNTQCLKRTQVLVYNYLHISNCTLSDLVCTSLPIFIVWRLSRSVIEKSLVIFLIATCLLATACGIPKVYYTARFDFNGDDQLWYLMPQVFWSRMEESIIIIAACAPLLKQPIERFVRRLGLPMFETRLRDIGTISTGVVSSKNEGAWPDEGARHWTLPSNEESASRTTRTRTENMELGQR